MKWFLRDLLATLKSLALSTSALRNRKAQGKAIVEDCLSRCQMMRRNIPTDPEDVMGEGMRGMAEIETSLESFQTTVEAIAAQLGSEYRASLELGEKFVQEMSSGRPLKHPNRSDVVAMKALKSRRDELFPVLKKTPENRSLLPIDASWEWGWFRLEAGLNALQRSVALRDGAPADTAQVTGEGSQRPDGGAGGEAIKNAPPSGVTRSMKSDQSELTPVAEQLRSGYLGLQFDDRRFRLTRLGRNDEIEFGTSRLPWHLLGKLSAGEDRWSSKEELERVWKAFGVDDRPAKGTFYNTIAELRQMVKPLGITIKNSRRVGWRLMAKHSTGRDKA